MPLHTLIPFVIKFRAKGSWDGFPFSTLAKCVVFILVHSLPAIVIKNLVRASAQRFVILQELAKVDWFNLLCIYTYIHCIYVCTVYYTF